MATTTVRTTFALDPATESTIQRLARRWRVSKAEVVRRSVAGAERQAAAAAAAIPPLAALEWLQQHGTLTEATAARWERDSRKGWKEAWQKRALPAKQKRRPSA